MRYWDGNEWSPHVSDNGVQSTDPVVENGNIADSIDRGLTFGHSMTADEVQRTVSGTGFRGAGITEPVAGGGGTLFNEPVLVVSQKAKLVEVTTQYSVFDQTGRPLGFVNEIGQSAARKAIRVLTNLDQFLTHRLQITDTSGAVVLELTRPGKVFKSTVIVGNGSGTEIGRIVQENMIGKIHFGLQAGGQSVGAIKAENWRAWNFRIEDHTGTEVARITKTWEGAMKQLFTTADNYVVQIHTPLPQPFISLVVAAALSIDTALKQDSK